MIGPSSAINNETTMSKRKMILDDDNVDIELSLCDEFLSTNNARKRFVQDQITIDRETACNPQLQYQLEQQRGQSPMSIPTVVVVVEDQASNTDFGSNFYSPPATNASTIFYSSSTENGKIGPVNRLGGLLVGNGDVGTGHCAWTTFDQLNENHCRRSQTFVTVEHSNVSKNNGRSGPLVETNNDDSDNGNDNQGFGRLNVAAGCEESFVAEDSTSRKGVNNAKDTDPEQEMDQDNGNLSWLLDFKLDSLIEAADDRCAVKGKEMLFGNINRGSQFNKNLIYADNGVRQWFRHAPAENLTNLSEDIDGIDPDSRQQNLTTDRRYTERMQYDRPKKPPFTYTELIEHALQERGELTVSAIYQWISERFPYYKSNDDRWKNSVRHNLSINPHFRKGSKAPHGAGHLWAIANPGGTKSRSITGSVITNSVYRPCSKSNEESHRSNGNGTCHMTLMDEVQAATASITSQTSNNETENVIHSVTLEHCAEQILSGIKKQVEVQYLVPMMVADNGEHDVRRLQEQANINSSVKESEFLNPVSKEVVAEECGLLSEGYLVTDLNPATLGLNMVEHEMITQDTLFGEDFSFQFYELTTPSTTTTSQIQSA